MIIAASDVASVVDAMSIWSIVASIVSVIVGCIAIALALTFFLASRKAEQSVKESLIKIETQATMLRDITEKQLDRLTRYATTRRRTTPPLPEHVVQALAQLPQTIMLAVQQGEAAGVDPQFLQELVDAHIAIYFYAAQANFWAQLMLPPANEFDTENGLHTLTQRIVDLSVTDFRQMDVWLGNINPAFLQGSRVRALLQEAINNLSPHVRSTADVFIYRSNPASEDASDDMSEGEESS